MLKRHTVQVMGLCCGLVWVSSVMAAGSGGIFLNTNEDGTIELSNISSQQGSELLVAPAPQAPVVPAPLRAVPSSPKAAVALDQNAQQPSNASASAPADKAQTDTLKTETGFAHVSPNEKYRDQVLQPQNARGGVQNQAISRRYTMQNRPPLAANSL